MQVLFTSDLFTYADIKASVAKDNYPNLSPGNAWLGGDIDAFLKYMRWHRPDLADRFVLGGTVFQDELQPIMKAIDPDFPGPDPVPVVPPVVPTVASIAISGALFAQVGVETYYKAEATMSDGGLQDVTNTAMWTSSNIHAATVDRLGVVNGRVTGKTNLRASMGGVFSPAYPINVMTGTPPAAEIVSIAVTGPASVVTGATAQYTATATMNDGTTQDVSATATWASSTAATATISATGLLTAVAAGSTSVTATVGTIASPVLAVTVAAATRTLLSIALTGNTSINEGSTSQLTATGTYDVAPLTEDVTTQSTYVVTGSAGGAVNASGLYTPANAGSGSIVANIGAVASPALVVTVAAVAPPTLVSIAITGATDGTAGADFQMTATGTYSDSSTQDLTSTATWASLDTNIATVNAAGLVHTLDIGTAQITATVGAIVSPTHEIDLI